MALSIKEKSYLRAGLNEPGGKLPLFDAQGQRIDAALVRSCMAKGYCAPWFANPLKPDWLVCRLTPKGRAALENAQTASRE
jgi:hypothetical protein